ncbi:hypothetical protein NM208_g12086 [Fusarium decemcellulare]|uniref:Uncharacterized protein n=1 Tax=Fusarium decemcellulare TaxID=57161 RepID=A0ACC1RTH2_9HYPO|nr:hypothetical protein NM208_g12086 [Fusarium decemcellulare]
MSSSLDSRARQICSQRWVPCFVAGATNMLDVLSKVPVPTRLSSRGCSLSVAANCKSNAALGLIHSCARGNKCGEKREREPHLAIGLGFRDKSPSTAQADGRTNATPSLTLSCLSKYRARQSSLVSTTMAYTHGVSSHSSILSSSGGTWAKEHADKALAEIGGLFAGFRYLDETEPASEAASNSSGPHADGHLRTYDSLELELEALSFTSFSSPSSNGAASVQQCDPQTIPSAHQIAWSSIRNVRHGMQILWQYFVNESLRLDLPIVHNLRNAYRDATGLREAGVFAFRNTLTGPPPNDLTKAFAFCSLSYVVSRLLHASGRLKKEDILAGVRLWLDALETKEEREAFRVLAQALWPEARTRLHLYDLGIDQHWEKLPTTVGRADYIPGIFPSTGLSPCSTLLQPQGWASFEAPAQEPHIEDLDQPRLGSPFAEPIAPENSMLNSFAGEESSVHAHNLMNMTYDTLHFSLGSDPPPNTVITTPPETWSSSGQFSHPNPDFSGQITMTNTAEPPSMSPAPSLEPSPDTAAHTNWLERLRDTMVFTAVVQYFQESRDFLYVLSGRGMLLNDPRSCLAWNQERLREKKHIRQEYLVRLVAEKHTKDAPSRGIVSVADLFVEIGYLQSVGDVQDYMTTIGKELIIDKVAYKEFREWVQVFRESAQPSPSSPNTDGGKAYVHPAPLNVNSGANYSI